MTHLEAAVAIPVQLETGITQGCVYGLLALGIVLVYKSYRIFNFAAGELGAFGAFITVSAARGLGPFPVMPAGVAVALGLVAGIFIALLAERVVIRPLFDAPRATLLVATAGIALTLATFEAVLLGTDITGNVLPTIGGSHQFALFGRLGAPGTVTFGWQQIVEVAALVAAALATIGFFRTRYGAAVLAVAQQPFAARAVGIDIGQISALVWGISGFLSAAAVIIFLSGGVFIPGAMSGFYSGNAPLIFGFIAAVLGGMTSLPGAFLGGLVLGVVEQLGGNYLPTAVPGGSTVVVCAVLLLVLLVRPTGLLGRET